VGRSLGEPLFAELGGGGGEPCPRRGAGAHIDLDDPADCLQERDHGRWLMSALVTASEIGAALGCGTRAVRLKAARGGWPFEECERSSQRKLYIADSLPEPVRAALGVGARTAPPDPQAARAEIAGQNRQAVWARGLARLAAPGGGRDRAEARGLIVRGCRDFVAHKRLGRQAGQEAFAAAYNSDAVDIPTWVWVEVPRLSARSIRRWARTLGEEGLGALDGRYGNRRGRGIIEGDAEVKDLILGMIVDHPHASAKLVMRGLRARFKKSRRPSYRTVQRYMRRWTAENRQLHAAVTNPDKWRSRFQAAGGDAAEGVNALNQLWELDSTPGDVILADGARHAILGVIDVWSRRVKIHVSRTSRATAIAALLRRALLDWGVPSTARTDEGSDYTSRHITRALLALDIEQDICPPFTPEAKPFIERALGTFLHDLLELMPGFIGHDVAGRKAIEARRSFADRLMKRGQEPAELRMTPEALQEFCDTWCEAIYAFDPHRGLGGQSPFERAAAWKGPVARIADERALDILLAEAPGEDGWRRVGKKGLRVEGAHYDAAELGGHEGSRVQVRFDDRDVGRVYVFTAEGEFLCIAAAPEIAGVSRREVAAARRAKQKASVAEGKKALKGSSKRGKTKDIAAEILRDAEVRAGVLIAFPGPHETHETPALDAAAQALAGPVEIADLTPEQQAAADAAWEKLNAGDGDENKVVALAPPAPEGARPVDASDCDFALWLIAHPEKASAEEKAWLDEKLSSNSFRLWVGLDVEDPETRQKARW